MKSMTQLGMTCWVTLGLLLGFVTGLQAAPWKHLTTSEGLPAMQTQFIKVQGGDVWVGTLEGLARFRDGKVETYLKGEPVWDVLTSGDTIWIGTDNGIVRQKGTVGERSLEKLAVGRMVVFGSNTIWAICKQRDSARLMQLAGGAWQPVERFARQKVADLNVARSGAVYVILEANGVVVATPGQPPEQWKHHQQGVNLTAFLEDKQGRFWFGTWDRGVMILENGEWKRMLTDEDAVITAVRQDGKGHIWVATNAHGVWQYDGANWINHLNEEGTINMLETSADGKVFVSSQTECSLRQWNGTGWDKVVDVPTMFITVRADAKGKLWAGNILDGVYVQP